MKEFFKKNFVVIILFLVALVCYLLTFVSTVFLPIATFFTGIPMIILAIRSKKKYNTLKEKVDNSEDYFDATSIDYDEDIYYVGESNKRVVNAKGFLNRMNSLGPVIIYSILGVAFIFFGIISLVDIFM